MAVTVEDLQQIFTTSLDEEQLEIHLQTATLVTTEQLTGKGLSASRLDKISLYLAAHYASTSELEASGNSGPLKSQKTGDAAESYSTISGNAIGYNNTRWGQIAIALDSSNTLAGISAVAATARGFNALFRVV